MIRSVVGMFIAGLCMAAVFSPAPAPAWNRVGHQVIAEMSWRRMSAGERHEIGELLKQHPHYEQYLIADVPAGVDTNEWAFLKAAIWPDWVRPPHNGQPAKPESVTKYDLYPHAIGLPFLAPGETNQTLLERFHIATPDAEMVLSNSIVTLKNHRASGHDRAVSLCWVIHLMGDLHQPLHAANRVSSPHPRGEGLGGEHFILEENGHRTTLHAFWDSLPGTDPAYEALTALADKLQAAPDLQRKVLPEYAKDKTIDSWVREGFREARDFAYSEQRVQFVIHSKKNGAPAAESLTKVTPEYVREGRQIAYRRVVLASFRLNDVLAKRWSFHDKISEDKRTN